MKTIITILWCLTLIGVGYYGGLEDGLHKGAIEYQNCMNNGATGWYVDKNKLNCIF